MAERLAEVAPGPGRRARTLAAVSAVVALVWLGLVWSLGPAPIASAHAYLLASTPPDGYALPSPPGEVALDFDQPVTIAATALALTDTAGKPAPLGPPTLSLAGRRLSASVPARLTDGNYRLRWQVTAEDGDLVSGVIRFAVGAATAVDTTTTTGSSLDSPVVIAGRLMLFAGLALSLGGLAGDLLARRAAREAGVAARALPGPPLLVGGGLGVLAGLVLAGQAGLSPELAGTAPGRVLIVELAGFVAATALALIRPRTPHRQPPSAPAARRAPPSAAAATSVGCPARIQVLVGLALLAVVGAEGWRAHPHAASPMWGSALTMAHLLVVSLWVGALVHLLRLSRQSRRWPGMMRLLVYDYSRLALAGVILIVTSGTLEAVLLLPAPEALITTGYGRLLLVKVSVVAMVLGLAVLARRRFQRSIASPNTPALGREARVEALGLAAVLAITALLISTAPPGPATTTLAAPPAPLGPTVSAGSLARSTTVIATASAGQLVVRLTVPDRDDLGTTNSSNNQADQSGAPPDYQITAQLDTRNGGWQTLTPRGCGPGCFTSPVSWRAGTNQLRIAVAAPPWPPASAQLDIPWPPHPDPAALTAMLTAMRAIPAMTVHQAVTSDYTGNPGVEIPLNISGADFLAAEPYNNGGGNPTSQPTGPGITEVRVAFPQGIAVRLLLGSDARILREEETTPNHLITSTFEYPATSG